MENRSQKKIFIVVALLLLSLTNINAQLDTRTQNQIKAKFLTAQELYDEKDYSGSLEKVSEIEELTNGQLLAAAQNLKVKCLVGQGKYVKAKEELYTLEGLNLSGDILKDISSYHTSIENFVKDEEEKNELLKKRIEPKLSAFDKSQLMKKENYLLGLHLDGKFGYINKNYEVVIPFIYENGHVGTTDDYIGVKLNSKWGLIDRNNNVIIPYKYDGISGISKLDLLAVKLDNKWGFIDKDDNLIIEMIYDTTWGFEDGNSGLAQVELNGKWGFINAKGIIVIPIKYDEFGLGFDKNGTINAKINGMDGKIDIKGNIVEPFK